MGWPGQPKEPVSATGPPGHLRTEPGLREPVVERVEARPGQLPMRPPASLPALLERIQPPPGLPGTESEWWLQWPLLPAALPSSPCCGTGPWRLLASLSREQGRWL